MLNICKAVLGNKKSKMNKNIQRYILLLLIVLCISCQGPNKTELPKNNTNFQLKSVDISDSPRVIKVGRPKSITRTIKQDRSGNIWFATWEGIIKYNGDIYTNITSNVGLSRFFSVLEDRKGNFWFGSIGSGVYYYEGKSFQNFTIKEGLVHNTVTNIYEDKKGDIWFGTEGGVSRYDGESFRNFTTREGLLDNDVNSIIEDKTGRIWFGTRGDACFYDGKTFTKFTNKNGMAFKNVRHIIEDSRGDIWLGGNDGLWRYDGSVFTNYTKKFVGYVYEDKKGNIWTSSESASIDGWALSRYDSGSLTNEKVGVKEIKAEQGMFLGFWKIPTGVFGLEH